MRSPPSGAGLPPAEEVTGDAEFPLSRIKEAVDQLYRMWQLYLEDVNIAKVLQEAAALACAGLATEEQVAFRDACRWWGIP